MTTQVAAPIPAAIDELYSQVEDRQSYTECLQQYFMAASVTNKAKQQAILLSACGACAYRLICSLSAPNNPKDTSLSDLMKLMSEHYQPKLSVTVQQFKFHSHFYTVHRASVATYVAGLLSSLSGGQEFTKLDLAHAYRYILSHNFGWHGLMNEEHLHSKSLFVCLLRILFKLDFLV